MLWLFQYQGSLEIFSFHLSCITFCCIFLPVKDGAKFKDTGEKENTTNTLMFGQNVEQQKETQWRKSRYRWKKEGQCHRWPKTDA